ncbi:hypothetical protein BH10BAC2_BH10BAC2_02360 [soil metagenome]
MFEDEAAAAENISTPKLERLIFATTISRDAKIQDILNELNQERIKSKKFTLEVWFWEDIQVMLERHTELLYWYYSDYLKGINMYDKNIHIMSMLRQAFTRPAFQREMKREENGSDFLAAIKNTQEAITTGNLYNRRGDLIASTFDYSKITNIKWKNIVWKVFGILDLIRDEYQQGLLKKKIVEHPTVIEIFDDGIAHRLNNLRKDCLKRINGILIEMQLKPIDSELIRI